MLPLADSLTPKGSVQPPAPVTGASWQAGVTADNSRFKVHLNGEPVPLAFAASIRRGWVMVYVGDGQRTGEHGLRTAGGTAVTRTLRGYVELFPGDRY